MPEVRLCDRTAIMEQLRAIEQNGKITDAQKFRQAKFVVENAPTIEAEPVRHGRWIPTEYDSYADGAPVWDRWECSVCCHEHTGEEDTLMEFCPNCGARMDLRTPTEVQLDVADSVMMGGTDDG